jgi:hypothetical protein
MSEKVLTHPYRVQSEEDRRKNGPITLAAEYKATYLPGDNTRRKIACIVEIKDIEGQFASVEEYRIAVEADARRRLRDMVEKIDSGNAELTPVNLEDEE